MDQPLKSTSPAPQSRQPCLRPTMDAWERQQTFREMVVHLLRNGPLANRRRRQLVQYAATLDISAVLAGRLINEARQLFDRRGAQTPPHSGVSL